MMDTAAHAAVTTPQQTRITPEIVHSVSGGQGKVTAGGGGGGAAEEGTRLEFLRGHPPQLPESTTLDGGSSADEKVPDLAALAAGAEGAAGSPNTAALAGDDGMGGFDV